MRTAKVSTQAAKATTGGNEATEPNRLPRLRKGSRSASASLSSATSSASSSDGELPGSPDLGVKVDRHQQRHAVVIDHQGAGKVVHKPDGTVVWEPAPEGPDASASRRGGRGGHPLHEVLGQAGLLVTLGSAVAGLMAVQQHTVAAARSSEPYCLTTKQLTAAVAQTVTAYLAGTATGLVVGPLLAVRSVAAVLVRPALVGLLLHQGVRRFREWKCGVAGLLRKLQSADPTRVLEALRAIIAAAARSPRFAREFNKLRGMEVLLQQLSAALPDCPWLHLLAQALAELCKDQECRDSLVAAGGVPRLVGLLGHPNPVVGAHCLAALACLTDHSLAVEAIREAGGMSRLVEIAAAAVAPAPPASVSSTSTAAAVPAAASSSGSSGGFDRRSMLLPAVKLLQALSLDPASKTAIGAAGGVSVLLDVISRSDPRSETQSEAIGALHNCLRGCPDNQRTLAALPAASEVLRGALGGFGPCWHAAKGDLHALLNVLARLQGVQEAGGFVVIQSQVAAAAAREGNTPAAPATTATGTSTPAAPATATGGSKA